MQKLFIIPPDGTVELSLSEGVDLYALQGLVGGYIQLVDMPEVAGDMYVNEEGLLMGLEHNVKASYLTGQYIVGTAVIVVEDK